MSKKNELYEQGCECGSNFEVKFRLATGLFGRIALLWCPGCGAIMRAEKSDRQWIFERPARPELAKQYFELKLKTGA